MSHSGSEHWTLLDSVRSPDGHRIAGRECANYLIFVITDRQYRAVSLTGACSPPDNHAVLHFQKNSISGPVLLTLSPSELAELVPNKFHR